MTKRQTLTFPSIPAGFDIEDKASVEKWLAKTIAKYGSGWGNVRVVDGKVLIDRLPPDPATLTTVEILTGPLFDSKSLVHVSAFIRNAEMFHGGRWQVKHFTPVSGVLVRPVETDTATWISEQMKR